MTTTHTPGPWNADVENCGGGLNVTDKNGHRLAHTAEHCDKDGTTIFTDEAKANARLIAAAPELLEALETITAAYTAFLTDLRNPEKAQSALNTVQYLDPAVMFESARAAIAKAKG